MLSLSAQAAMGLRVPVPRTVAANLPLVFSWKTACARRLKPSHQGSGVTPGWQPRPPGKALYDQQRSTFLVIAAGLQGGLLMFWRLRRVGTRVIEEMRSLDAKLQIPVPELCARVFRPRCQNLALVARLW